MMMEKEKFYLGIDLGTSAAKGVLRDKDGRTFKARETYVGAEPNSWLEAVKHLISELKKLADVKIAAVSVSSQVGTYIVDGKEVISWRTNSGKEELEYIKSQISSDEFINEIGMPHPDLISYPLPRLLFIQKHYGEDVEVLMPKELLIRELTGETVTDVFSMRGIANIKKRAYATKLIEKLGIKIKLPELKTPTDLAGKVTDEAAVEYGLEKDTPVYLGCNDFFAGLIGMGIYEDGDFFDLSGTSEHIGYISKSINKQGFVSGDYFSGCCSYGGTKASGVSCDFAIKNFGIDDISIGEILSKKPPIFLPYLCGERAPIFDESARGVFFGIDENTDKKCLAYAVLEGVIFSIYDIAVSMNAPTAKRLICGGGSAKNTMMNTLRATMFNCPVVSVSDNDTSALGACMLAMVADGVYSDISLAISDCVKYLPIINPNSQYQKILKERFEIYKSLYADLKQTFKKLNKINYFI